MLRAACRTDAVTVVRVGRPCARYYTYIRRFRISFVRFVALSVHGGTWTCGLVESQHGSTAAQHDREIPQSQPRYQSRRACLASPDKLGRGRFSASLTLVDSLGLGLGLGLGQGLRHTAHRQVLPLCVSTLTTNKQSCLNTYRCLTCINQPCTDLAQKCTDLHGPARTRSRNARTRTDSHGPART
jgi:hypothetical protein